ncbi:MAG: heavy metal-associated domain-containing protein [Azospirillaceae bacterium]|nr:heavy metal-associated domain-containing protein [Azospirillaceae bacterium]
MSESYKVNGMTCDGCARSVSKALIARLPDVQVTVDLARGTVTLEGEGDPAIVKAAVEGAGFDFAGQA